MPSLLQHLLSAESPESPGEERNVFAREEKAQVPRQNPHNQLLMLLLLLLVVQSCCRCSTAIRLSFVRDEWAKQFQRLLPKSRDTVDAVAESSAKRLEGSTGYPRRDMREEECVHLKICSTKGHAGSPKTKEATCVMWERQFPACAESSSSSSSCSSKELELAEMNFRQNKNFFIHSRELARPRASKPRLWIPAATPREVENGNAS